MPPRPLAQFRANDPSEIPMSDPSEKVMPGVFPSVREALIAVLSGAVDPVPVVTARHQAGCPMTDAHHANKSSGGRSLDLSQENTWSIIVRLAGNDDIGSKEVDIRALTAEDIRKLKTEDPFLYYSIPYIRRGSYLCDCIDDGDNIRMAKLSSSHDPSLPTDYIGNVTTHRLRQENVFCQEVHTDTRRHEFTVQRNCRVSTEAHPSLLLDDLMLLELEELDGGATNQEMDCTYDDLKLLLNELDQP